MYKSVRLDNISLKLSNDYLFFNIQYTTKFAKFTFIAIWIPQKKQEFTKIVV